MNGIRQPVVGSTHKSFRRMSGADRLRVITVVIAVPVAVFLAMASRETSKRLVAVIDDQPAQVVADCATYLEGREIPFEVRDGGHDLWVPASLRAELKIELARLIGADGKGAAVPRGSSANIH